MKNLTKRKLICLGLILAVAGPATCLIFSDDGSSGSTTNSFSQSQADEISSKTTAACEGLDVVVKLQTDQHMSEQREENKNAFTEAVDLLIEVYKNQDWMKLLDIKLAILIVIVLFMVFVIISTIIFLVNICICCCNGKDNNKGCCISCNLVISLVGLVGFTGCCIMLAVYVTGVKNGMNEVNCALHKVNNDIVNGNKSVNDFMGFFPLTNVLNQYIADFEKLVNNHKGNLQDIVNYDLENDSKSALDSIDTFHSANKDQQTPDGVGTNAITHSTSDVLSGFVDAATTEFTALHDTCKAVHEGAESGLEQVNNPDMQSVIDSIKELVNTVLGIIVTFDASFGSIGNTYETVDTQYNLAQIIFIVFCFGCLLIALLIFIGLCCAYNNKGCDKFCCCRIIIAVLGIFCLIFMIFSFAVAVVAFATSATCGMMQTFGNEKGINDFIDLFQLEGDMKIILTTCLLETGDGNLTTIFMGDGSNGQSNTDMFKDVQVLLDMFDSYQDLLAAIPADKMSVAFTQYKEAVTKFKTGELPDHDNVANSLATLNQIISCHTEEYSLTAASCPSGKTCIDLSTTTSYSNPGCADAAQDADASKLVTDLNRYINATITLVDDLIKKSYDQGTTPTSPNELYHETTKNFFLAIDKLNLIKTDLSATIAMLENNDIMQGTNCKILRAEFQTLETTMCFSFVPNLYKFMLVAFIASCFFFSFLWHFCCGTFCLERSGEHGEDAQTPEDYDNTQFNPKGHTNNYYK